MEWSATLRRHATTTTATTTLTLYSPRTLLYQSTTYQPAVTLPEASAWGGIRSKLWVRGRFPRNTVTRPSDQSADDWSNWKYFELTTSTTTTTSVSTESEVCCVWCVLCVWQAPTISGNERNTVRLLVSLFSLPRCVCECNGNHLCDTTEAKIWWPRNEREAQMYVDFNLERSSLH